MTPNKGGRKYAMKGKKDKDVYWQAIIMIDPATGWLEIRMDIMKYLGKEFLLTMFSISSMAHTTMQQRPSQVLLGWDLENQLD